MISFLHDCSSLEMHVGESFDLLSLLSFPLFIDISLSFILLFSLTKPHSWILLVDSFPMTVTILKSEFRSKVMASQSLLSQNSPCPPHTHVASTWIPLSSTIQWGIDVTNVVPTTFLIIIRIPHDPLPIWPSLSPTMSPYTFFSESLLSITWAPSSLMNPS
jgi:hypothetical protein